MSTTTAYVIVICTFIVVAGAVIGALVWLAKK